MFATLQEMRTCPLASTVSGVTTRSAYSNEVKLRPWPKAKKALACLVEPLITGSESGIDGRKPINWLRPVSLRPGNMRRPRSTSTWARA